MKSQPEQQSQSLPPSEMELQQFEQQLQQQEFQLQQQVQQQQLQLQHIQNMKTHLDQLKKAPTIYSSNSMSNKLLQEQEKEQLLKQQTVNSNQNYAIPLSHNVVPLNSPSNISNNTNYENQDYPTESPPSYDDVIHK